MSYCIMQTAWQSQGSVMYLTLTLSADFFFKLKSGSNLIEINKYNCYRKQTVVPDQAPALVAG